MRSSSAAWSTSAEGRSVGATGRTLTYAAVTLAIDELTTGALPARHARSLTLEVPLFAGPETLDALSASLPRGETLFFLRNKGGDEAEFYRLAVMEAVIVNRDGAAETVSDDS